MNNIQQNKISSECGTYIIILHNTVSENLAIGRAGSLQIQPGYYLYVGSAFGPGGLRARAGRHLAGSNKCRWHIDYLRKVTRPYGAWLTAGGARAEHHWAQTLACMPAIKLAMPGFGASDCNCATHLFYTQTAPSVADFNNGLRQLGFAANATALNWSA